MPFLWFLVALKMIYKLHVRFTGYPAVTRLQSLLPTYHSDFAFSFSCICCISDCVICSRNWGLTLIALVTAGWCGFLHVGFLLQKWDLEGRWLMVLGQLDLCFLTVFANPGVRRQACFICGCQNAVDVGER